jgi:hypothetical protein
MATAMTGARRRGQKRAAAKVKVSAHTVGGPGEMIGDGNWKAEQKKRLTAQVAALEKELKNFDAVAAAAKVRASLDLELRRTKLRLEQNELEDL